MQKDTGSVPDISVKCFQAQLTVIKMPEPHTRFIFSSASSKGPWSAWLGHDSATCREKEHIVQRLFLCWLEQPGPICAFKTMVLYTAAKYNGALPVHLTGGEPVPCQLRRRNGCSRWTASLPSPLPPLAFFLPRSPHLHYIKILKSESLSTWSYLLPCFSCFSYITLSHTCSYLCQSAARIWACEIRKCSL